MVETALFQIYTEPQKKRRIHVFLTTDFQDVNVREPVILQQSNFTSLLNSVPGMIRNIYRPEPIKL